MGRGDQAISQDLTPPLPDPPPSPLPPPPPPPPPHLPLSLPAGQGLDTAAPTKIQQGKAGKGELLVQSVQRLLILYVSYIVASCIIYKTWRLQEWLWKYSLLWCCVLLLFTFLYLRISLSFLLTSPQPSTFAYQHEVCVLLYNSVKPIWTRCGMLAHLNTITKLKECWPKAEVCVCVMCMHVSAAVLYVS